MIFNIITIFPEMFTSYFGDSIIERAQKEGRVDIRAHDLRSWTTDKHKTVDDTPYGGGAGMLLKIDPLYRAIKDVAGVKRGSGQRVVLLSARGKKWTQELAREYSKFDEVSMICGRYEGVDERITNFIDEEISIGDYVLTGGELGAMVMIDSITRLLPGVLGNEESIVSESHSVPGQIEYPQYTRPEVFEVDGKEYRVPDILLSGDHGKIKKWREVRSKK